MKSKNYLLFVLTNVLGVLLLSILTACSTGTSEFVRIVPTAGQSIQDIFNQTHKLVSEWEEFIPNISCSDHRGNDYYVYKIRPELAKHYYGIIITVLYDSKNELLFLEYTYQGKNGAMSSETKELFEKVLSRLKNELSADRIVQLDRYDENSIEWRLLHRLFDGGVVTKFSCT